jgi:TonB family protein
VSDGAAAELCEGEDAVRLASAAPKGSTEKTRQLQAAADHFRRAATLASKNLTKGAALNLLAGVYDADYLNDPKQMEGVIRELIALVPDELAPVFRLAKLQEREGLIDGAEETLLTARHRQPDHIEPNRMLAQFYARRVTALHKQEMQNTPQPVSNPGEPDANGVYQVGGPVAPPPRDDVPHYSPEAAAAGIEGVVVAQIVIDSAGKVTDAKVVQSIPLLDDEALRTVRNWHFAPTMVNGQPVPVRMNVNVNFTLRR